MPERRLLSLAEALAMYEGVGALPTVKLDLASALGRVLADPCRAAVDLPSFTQSAMDGYAIRGGETGDATPTRPVVMPVAGTVAAGEALTPPMLPGTAFRIFTGAPLPVGSDAVVRQEIVERSGNDMLLREAVPVGANVRYRGEELQRGDTVAGAGQRINAGLLGALAMAGVHEVIVHGAPRVTVLVTGDEVAREADDTPAGRIHDANGPMITAWLVERGYPAPVRIYVPDDPAAVHDALAQALDSSDLVITTGGVSVGDRDYIPSTAESLGVEKKFWKVAQKPGKPLWFGRRGSSWLMGMPGNPGAVLVCLAVHAAAVLARLEGEARAIPDWSMGELAQEVESDDGRDRLLRMSVIADDGRLRLVPLPRQESHMLSNLASASALVWLPRRDQTYAAGELLRYIAL
ncbi:gephyrin-like molybdotransferase Glp [Pinirhizobacter sp.]|jgi:molybdopterin molybdotransferase|uniref:molybdopterin molybdotransferase MoeA n=1 Tax=Pinirhizobacter sp. TaxID=2950432 RepID=UPI002F3FCBC4